MGRTIADMTYHPRPIDTSKVTVPPELLALAEQLAHNAHEVWAQKRMQDGWRWGPERSDARKEHPSLVPYEELTDEEQEYDRQVAMETIRAILAMGFRISPP